VELDPLLEKEFKDKYGELFTIRLLPEKHLQRTYYIQFEYEWEGFDKFFGNAKKVLDVYNKLIDK